MGGSDLETGSELTWHVLGLLLINRQHRDQTMGGGLCAGLVNREQQLGSPEGVPHTVAMTMHCEDIDVRGANDGTTMCVVLR
ncbi:hypothetical protein D3C71_1557330 [compost metagenome]